MTYKGWQELNPAFPMYAEQWTSCIEAWSCRSSVLRCTLQQ